MNLISILFIFLTPLATATGESYGYANVTSISLVSFASFTYSYGQTAANRYPITEAGFLSTVNIFFSAASENDYVILSVLDSNLVVKAVYPHAAIPLSAVSSVTFPVVNTWILIPVCESVPVAVGDLIGISFSSGASPAAFELVTDPPAAWLPVSKPSVGDQAITQIQGYVIEKGLYYGFTVQPTESAAIASSCANVSTTTPSQASTPAPGPGPEFYYYSSANSPSCPGDDGDYSFAVANQATPIQQSGFVSSVDIYFYAATASDYIILASLSPSLVYQSVSAPIYLSEIPSLLFPLSQTWVTLPVCQSLAVSPGESIGVYFSSGASACGFASDNVLVPPTAFGFVPPQQGDQITVKVAQSSTYLIDYGLYYGFNIVPSQATVSSNSLCDNKLFDKAREILEISGSVSAKNGFLCNSFISGAVPSNLTGVSLALSTPTPGSGEFAYVYVFDDDSSAPLNAPRPYFCGGPVASLSPSSLVPEPQLWYSQLTPPYLLDRVNERYWLCLVSENGADVHWSYGTTTTSNDVGVSGGYTFQDQGAGGSFTVPYTTAQPFIAQVYSKSNIDNSAQTIR